MPTNFEPLPLSADTFTGLGTVKTGKVWVPMLRHACSFGPEVFADVMMNLIKNPNHNSSWLFRADILQDNYVTATSPDLAPEASRLIPVEVDNIPLYRTLVRRLIPRNIQRDTPLLQTCTFHQSSLIPPDTRGGYMKSLVIYVPHVRDLAEMPFYHPKVMAVAHLHEWSFENEEGYVSVHYLPFREHPIDQDSRLQRTAHQLLQILHKHGQGVLAGYTKRVHHDTLISQAKVQDRYALLKTKHARHLINNWAESTDPLKHVFEDLGIAAFLIELWADMYENKDFPGFIDIGCGNGLLVHLLNQEGYLGWGFDARSRKSWKNYQSTSLDHPGRLNIEQRLLLPAIASKTPKTTNFSLDPAIIHNGMLPSGTFIISNHADELTPWTPVLAALSNCPFMMIPCCSNDLRGQKYRPPPPKDPTKSKSTYASFVDWVSQISLECGWKLETEALRIPSTRNICLIGRQIVTKVSENDMNQVLVRFGGTDGFADNVAGLVKGPPRSH